MSNAMDRLSSLRVRDVMSRGVVQISMHQSMADAARAFAEHDISAAPVVDDRGRCVGFLSAVDFLPRPTSEVAAAEDRSIPASGEERVSKYMTGSVQSVEPDAPLLRAAQIMCRAHVHRLPVINGGRLVGVVSTMDLVAALMNSIEEMRARQFQPIDF